MPYDNELNRKIAKQIKNLYLNQIESNKYSYDIAESDVGYANKSLLNDENVYKVKNKLMDMEQNLPENNELSGGALGSRGAFARGTFRDTGFERVEGAGFFDSVLSGIKSVVKPASQILSLIPHPYAQTASTGLNVASNLLGNAKKQRKPRTKKVSQELLLKRQLEGGKPNINDIGVLSKTKKTRGRPNKMKGGADLGEPHNMIKPDGTTGNGKLKRKIGGQKIVPVAQMQSSGMSGQGKQSRSELVKKIMKERNVNMIQASSIIKKEGLYKSKK